MQQNLLTHYYLSYEWKGTYILVALSVCPEAGVSRGSVIIASFVTFVSDSSTTAKVWVTTRSIPFRTGRRVAFELIYITYTYSVRTSQETHYITAAKTTRLMLFREIVAVCCENQTKCVNISNWTVFWDVIPCSLVEINWRFGGTYCLHIQGRRFAKHATSKKKTEKPLNSEAVLSSETPVNVYRTTRHHIPEGYILRSHRCHNGKHAVWAKCRDI
jgi:hypothetical protein